MSLVSRLVALSGYHSSKTMAAMHARRHAFLTYVGSVLQKTMLPSILEMQPNNVILVLVGPTVDLLPASHIK